MGNKNIKKAEKKKKKADVKVVSSNSIKSIVNQPEVNNKKEGI